MLTQTIQIFLGLCNSSVTTQRSPYHANITRVSLLWPYSTWSSTKWLHKKNPWWASLQPLYCAVGVYGTVFVNCGVILYFIFILSSTMCYIVQVFCVLKEPDSPDQRSKIHHFCSHWWVLRKQFPSNKYTSPQKWSVRLTWEVRLTLSKSIN